METLNAPVSIDIQIQINAYIHALMYRVLGFDGRVEVASMMSSGTLETSYIFKILCANGYKHFSKEIINSFH